VVFTTPSTIPLRILKAVPLLSPLFVRNSNLLLKFFYYKFKKSVHSESVKSYLFPNHDYESRAGLDAFFRDLPFSHHSPSYKVVEDIKEHVESLTGMDWHIVQANQVSFLGRRSLKKWKKNFSWSTFEFFKDENHFMLECEDNEVIKYIRTIVR
jgi:hypothetical protein